MKQSAGARFFSSFIIHRSSFFHPAPSTNSTVSLRSLISSLTSGRHVRPWALSAPIVVLLICLPMLRPLRQPDPRLIADDEQARLATVQAIVEQHTLAIEGTAFSSTHDKIAVGAHLYSNQPPMLAVLLSGPYWVIHRLGWSFDRDPEWVAYLLTLLGVTLPVALSAGVIYRMGRLFELRRPVRAALGLVVVCGSGLISYATVLNSHASAATLLLSAFACLFYATLAKSRWRGFGWLGAAGLCAALAACIDPPASIFLVLLFPVIVALRWPAAARIAGIALYGLGAVGPILLHAKLMKPITGDLKPGLFHPELAANPEDATANELLPTAFRGRSAWSAIRQKLAALSQVSRPAAAVVREEDDDEPVTFWRGVGYRLSRGASIFLGPHGIFSHFPLLIFGIVGMSMVMHRHWPGTTKVLAAATIMGSLTVIGVYAAIRCDLREAMFATRWFVPFLPLVLFWIGAWLRKPHRPAAWGVAGVFLIFSVAASLVGATGPLPRAGFDRYTVAGAIHNLRHPPQPPVIPPLLADRSMETQ
jgi:hypothetical protein